MNVIYVVDVEAHTDCKNAWPVAGLLAPERKYHTPFGEVGILQQVQDVLHVIPTPFPGRYHEVELDLPPFEVTVAEGVILG